LRIGIIYLMVLAMMNLGIDVFLGLWLLCLYSISLLDQDGGNCWGLYRWFCFNEGVLVLFTTIIRDFKLVSLGI
jgi:hypothetical protein